jgi:DNA adenine methylase
MQKPRARVEVVNDKELQIVNLYRHLRDASQHLAMLLDLTPYSRSEYYSAKSRGLSLEDTRKTLVASYMGVGNSLADSSNGFRNSKKSTATPSRSWASYVNQFEQLHERIRGAMIEGLDWSEIFEKYDTPETLWYLDPPYVWSTRSKQQANRAYSHEMSNEDHIRFIERIQSLKGMVILSGYDHPIYEALPWQKVQAEANTQRNATRIESLWLNDAVIKAQNQMSLFEKDKAHEHS